MRSAIRVMVIVVVAASGGSAFADGAAPSRDDAARDRPHAASGVTTWAGAAGGAASGAAAGLLFGPVGVAAGSVIGGVIGFLGGSGAGLHGNAALHPEEVGGGRGEPGSHVTQDETQRRAKEQRAALDEYNHRRFLEQTWTAP